MIKHDFGHLNCPYYEHVLDNGMRIFILKSQSTLQSCVLSVLHGGCLRVSEIMSVKIPQGTPYVLSKLILDEPFRAELEKEGIVSSAEIDYSSVFYSLSTMGDICSALEKLMDRILHFDYDEKDLDAFRQRENMQFRENRENPVLLSRHGALNNLYFSSAIRNEYLIDDNSLKLIHMNQIRKYFDANYVPSDMALFISTDKDPKEVLDKVKEMKMLAPLTLAEKRITEKENYSKPARIYSEAPYSGKDSYFTVAIKFDAKRNVYQKFGDLYFYYGEILMDTCFSKNPAFLDGLSLRKAELVKATLEKTGEDTCALITVRGEHPKEIAEFAEDYLNHLKDYVSSSLYHKVLTDFYADSLRTLSLPSQEAIHFACHDLDGISYTQLISQVMRASFSSYRSYLECMSKYARAAFFLKKGI